MEKETRNSTRNIVMLLYIFAFIYIYIIKKLPISTLLIVYLILTLILIFLFYTSLLGMFGNYFFAKGDYKKAEKYLKKAIKKNTHLPTTYLNYGILQILNKNYDEAIKYIDIAKSKTKNTYVYKNIITTQASTLILMEEYDDAIEILERFMESYSNKSEDIYPLIAYAYFKKENYEKALEYINIALEIEPKNISAMEIKGLICFNLNYIKRAKKCFLKALELDENSLDSNFYMGLILEKEKNDSAKDYFLKASKSDKKNLSNVGTKELNDKLIEYKIKKP